MSIAFLSGRYREIEQRLEFEMRQAAAEQRYEDAARERNRLRAVRRLLERQRVSVDQGGTFDAIAVAVAEGEANAQVLQVRDGVLSDRQSFYLENAADADPAEVTEAFIIQYYASAMMIPPLVVVEQGVAGPEAESNGDGPVARAGRAGPLSIALSERRGSRVEVREAERGDKRRILELAQRNARLALDQEKLRSERRRQQRTEAMDQLQQALGLETLPLRIECYDISTLMGTNTVASMVVFEGAAPKKSDYRRFKVRSVGEDGPDDFAAMEEILGRRMAQFEAQEDRSPHDKEYDPSFAALPNLIVIDGGKGQLSAGLRALDGFLQRGVAVVSLAKRIEEVFIPGRADVAGAAARHAGAAAAAAAARRGAQVRDHAPPPAARPRDDGVDPRRAAGRRAGAQAGAADALRVAGRGARGVARGARGGARDSGAAGARTAPRTSQDGSLKRSDHIRSAW